MARPAGQSPTRTSQRLASGNANASVALAPPNGNQPLAAVNQPIAAGNQNQNPNIPINLQPNVNVKVDGAGLDTFVPVIPEVRTEDTKELFKVKCLTKLEGEPIHVWMEKVMKELGRNSIAVKCSFGGDKLGCLGTVYNNTRFRAKSGHDWIVPASRGAFSTFPNGATLA